MLTYKKLFYIYEIVNDVTQKKYIGMTFKTWCQIYRSLIRSPDRKTYWRGNSC